MMLLLSAVGRYFNSWVAFSNDGQLNTSSIGASLSTSKREKGVMQGEG